MKNNREHQRAALFERARALGLFWSYAPDIVYTPAKDQILAEQIMRYGDLPELRQLFALYDRQWLQHIWECSLRCDARFLKTNYLLARQFFGLQIEASDLLQEGTHDSQSRISRIVAAHR